MSRQVARDISYASSAQTKGGRAMIRVLENATGRMRLIKRAAGYQHEVARGADFWSVMVVRYGLSLDVIAGSLGHRRKNLCRLFGSLHRLYGHKGAAVGFGPKLDLAVDGGKNRVVLAKAYTCARVQLGAALLDQLGSAVGEADYGCR